MKNNTAKRIGAFLLAASITAPGSAEFAALNTVRVSAENEVLFRSETSEVSGAVFTVEVKAVSDVSDFNAEKFTLCSDENGEEVIDAAKIMTVSEGNGVVGAEDSVVLTIEVAEDTADGVYYLFYDGDAVGLLEYSAAAEASLETVVDESLGDVKTAYVAYNEEVAAKAPTLKAENVTNYYVSGRTYPVQLKLTIESNPDKVSFNKDDFRIGSTAPSEIKADSKSVILVFPNNTGGEVKYKETKICTVTATPGSPKNSDVNKWVVSQGDVLEINFATGVVNTVAVSGDTETLTEVGCLKYEKVDSSTPVPTNGISDVKWVVAGAKVVKTDNPEVIRISGTKASGAFNGNVKIKAVDIADDKKVYGSFDVFVTAPKTTSLSVKEKAGVLTKKSGAENEYELKIAAGSVFKLPVTAVGGANKLVTYEAKFNTNDPIAFSVVNGVVKGLIPGASGTIKVNPQDGTTGKEVTINVTVESPAKYAARTDATSFALVPGGAVQYFTIGGTTFDGTAKVTKIEFDSSVYTVKAGSSNISSGAQNNTLTNGAITYSVALQTGKTAADIKNKPITVTVESSGKPAKNIVIKPSFASVYSNIKSFKQTGKANADDKIVVDVPVGTAYNLGLSVTPATANNEVSWTIEKGGQSSTDISITGDVLYAAKAGTYEVYATSVAKNDRNKTIDSKHYIVNVYESASGFALNNDSNYGIVGGCLVSNPKEDCDKLIKGGQKITINAPTVLGKPEDVIWTSNKPNALAVAVNSSDQTKLDLELVLPGSYTVTGVTKYSKQKISFKVNVEENLDHLKDAASTYEYLNSDNVWKALNDNTEFKAGSVVNVRLKAIDSNADKSASAKLAFSVSDKTKASINASGVLKINAKANAGDTFTINGTMSSKNTEDKLENAVTIKIAAADPEIKKVVVPAWGVAGQEIKVSMSGKNIQNCEWETKTDGVTKQYPNAKTIKIDVAGKYEIYPVLKTGDTTYTKIPGFDKTITIFTDTPKTVALDAKNNTVKVDHRTSESDSNSATAYRKPSDLAKSAYKYSTYYVPFFAYSDPKEGTEAAGATTSTAVADITWTSSNNNIATVETAKDSDFKTSDNKYYAAAKITTYGYEGKVTLTGEVKNSGKKIKITLNVTKDDAFDADNKRIALENFASNMSVGTPNTAPGTDKHTVTIDVTLPTGVDEVDTAKLDMTKFGLSSSATKFIKHKTLVIKDSKLSDDKKKVTITMEVPVATETTDYYVAYNGKVNEKKLTYTKTTASESK